MLTDVILFLAGLVLLYLGADFLVRGAAQLASLARISPLIVGVTVVALGTSSPEILVSFIAALTNQADVAVGNIVGSNIANIALILGISAFIKPITVRENKINKEVYWMIAASLLFWGFVINGHLTHLEGIILLLMLTTFIYFTARTSIKERKITQSNVEIPVDKRFQNLSKPLRIVIYLGEIIIGIIVLVYGSNITVDAAVNIARAIGVSEIIIGLTLVAFGTSLPELATSLISIIKKESDILVGNVIGSNIFNLLFVGGGVSAFINIPIRLRVIEYDIPIMMAISLVLIPVIFFWHRIPRFLGIVLLLSYFGYIGSNYYLN